MIRSLSVRRGLALLLAASTCLLAACGSSSNSGGDAQWRVLNLTGDLPSVDVYSDTTNTPAFSGVATGVVSSYSTIGSGTYVVRVAASGNTNTLFSGSYTLSPNQHYTGLVWGSTGALQFATLPEDDDTTLIATGNSQVRVYNATAGSGALDVYLTQNITDLTNATPTVSGVASAALSGYKALVAGTYRLRVTSAGNPGDVRLDVPAVTLTAQQDASIIITSGSGGVLVNGALLVQQGAVTTYGNGQSRLRVAAGEPAGSGTVSVLIDGQPLLASSLSSPVVSAYATLVSGSHTVDVQLNGTSISSTTQSFTAGADYTLLAYKPDASGVQLLSDDNLLPAIGQVKVRLINADASQPLLTLLVDNSLLASDVIPGTVTTAITTPTVTNQTSTLTVSPSNTSSTLYTSPATVLQSQGIYSVFMLAGASTGTTGVLRKDR
jgi:hypothetical protein